MNFKKQVISEALQAPNIKLEKLPEEKLESLSEIYSSLSEYQLLHCHIFLKFYWNIWRIGVIEASTSIKKSNLQYNNYIKSIYICRQRKGIDDFMKLNLIDTKMIYVNSSMSLFKILNFKNPGLFECFGFCHKNLQKRLVHKLTLYPSLPNVKWKYELNQQLGGSILINKQGKVVFIYKMKYLGDHCPSDLIISFAKSYFGLNMTLNLMNNNEKKEKSIEINNKEKQIRSSERSDLLHLNGL